MGAKAPLRRPSQGRRSAWLTATLAGALIGAAVPAAARDGGGSHGDGHAHGDGHFHGNGHFHDHGHFHGGIFFGGVWAPYAFGYDYPYPYLYSDPYAYAYPYSMPPGPATWYYCAASNAYYPYVATCAVPWQPVVPQPR